MKLILKQNIHFFLFLFVCILWIGIFLISPDFWDNPTNGVSGTIILFGHFGLICLATFFLIYIAAINKYFFAVFFPVFALFGSVLAFYRYAYKATLTPMLIDATLHNDMRTTLDVISGPLIMFVFVCLFISGIIVWFRIKKISLNHNLLNLIISVSLLSIVLFVNGRVRNSIMQRFPFSIYYNFAEYQRLQNTIPIHRINPDPTVSCKYTDSLTVVLVIGESLRADHLSLNGYKRMTNPRLTACKNVVSFPHIFSEYTNTNRSLPHILTMADSAHTERAFNETSFVPLFKLCGYKSAWITNQDPAETYVGFMKECDTIMYCHPEKSVYNYNVWLDEDLMPFTNKELTTKSLRKLIILHTIGSHWYYNNHYSKAFEEFKPVTSSRILAQCSPEEIINSYDNTVLYTDYFLDRLIKQIETKNAILIYLSDHGETLGEGGSWLHAGDNAASKNPACIVWYSNGFKNKYPDKIEAIKKNKNRFIRTDFLFQSILSAGNIPSTIIQNNLNIFYNSDKTNK